MLKWIFDYFRNRKYKYRLESLRSKYRLNCVLVPKDLESYPPLSSLYSAHKFVAPRTVDLRDYCTKTENQGDKPWCAAYTAAGYTENILWRKNDYIEEVDPAMIYREAKRLDGSPNTDGTSLDAVLKVLLNARYFDPKICKIQMIWNYPGWEESLKYAIHKFGCCLLACNITEEWYLCGQNKTSITGNSYNTSVGGHAILACGYNEDGIIIHNSWGEGWGAYGYALITWAALRKQFIYAACLSNALDNFKMK